MTETTREAAAAARAAGQGEDRTSLRSGLLEERRGYVQRGLADRVDQVDEQLAALEPSDAKPDDVDLDDVEQDDVEQDEQADPADPADADPGAEPPTPRRGRGSAKAAAAAAAQDADKES